PSVPHQDRRFAEVFGPGTGSLAPLRARALRCLLAAEKQELPSTEPELSVCNPRPTPGDQLGSGGSSSNANSEEPWRTEISELDTLWGAKSDEVDAEHESYGDMPLIVLTADGTYANAPQPDAQKAAQLWW